MRRLALISVTALLLAGCTSSGSDDEPTAGGPSASTGSGGASGSTGAAPGGPECADVWKAGATLPEDYTSCVTDGAAGTQEVTPCDDGTRLVAYDNSYYALTGGKIVKPAASPMQDSKEYGDLYVACAGE